MNLSLSQTLLTFLLYVRQTWVTQLILAISLWRFIFLSYKRILVLICMVSQFMWRKNFIFRWHVSLEDSADSYLCFRLALLHLMSYFFFLYHLLHLFARFFILFHRTHSINPLHQPMCLFLETLTFIKRSIICAFSCIERTYLVSSTCFDRFLVDLSPYFLNQARCLMDQIYLIWPKVL